MGVPKQRKTKARQSQRRMHLFLETPLLTLCPKCGKPVKPHTVCFHCGYYKGEEVIDVLKKLTKKEKKARAKEMKAKEAEEKKETKRKEALSWEELSKK